MKTGQNPVKLGPGREGGSGSAEVLVSMVLAADSCIITWQLCILEREYRMMKSIRLVAPLILVLASAATSADEATSRPAETCRVDGYRGIWYANQPQPDEYKFKYSGGLGTYCAKHIPLAIYAEEARKTFFVYGGVNDAGNLDASARSLWAMVSYYDHERGVVPKPTMLMDKRTSDAHDNPVLSIDGKGYLWVFVAAHGKARPAYLFRSREPYSIDAFELVWETNFSYPQPWYIDGKGFLFLHTRYTPRRELFAMTSEDGFTWSEPQHLSGIAQGHYQISRQHDGKVGTAFNYHPADGGLNARTNLYYMESRDFGKTWRTAAGKALELPLKDIDNPALVRDYEQYGQLVYMKDLTFDPRGNPIILFLTSRGYKAGPESGPRVWNTARWSGREWEVTGIIRSDNNYDTGCLYIDKIRYWRLLAPTETGPQPFNPGGEVAMWVTDDLGRSWYKKNLTENSEYNHAYLRRPVNAHRDFEAFWADGHGRQPSESRLYFADHDGNVYRLPTQMPEDFAKPEKLPRPKAEYEWRGPLSPEEAAALEAQKEQPTTLPGP